MRKLLRRLLWGLGIGLFAAGVVYVLLLITAQEVPEHPFFAGDGLQVIAHQGGDGERPSNTMVAFTHAAELGVDVLEMDIHSTSDGVLVTIHDDTVDRTTDGTGRVQTLTFAQLQALDAGYDWPTLEGVASAQHPYRGQGITIPALVEVFQAFPDYRMNIEIKQRTPSLVRPFCALLRQYAMTDQVLVASFHAQALVELRRECPEVPTSSAEGEIRTFFVMSLLTLSPAYHPVSYAFQVPEAIGGLQVVTESFVRGAQAHNIAVHVWTVNDEADMQRMIALGVDGIITDYPERLLRLLGR